MNSGQIARPLTERLVSAKYLFYQGSEALESGSAFAAGLAVLIFHDSVEMTLRVVGEHIGADLKPITPFHQIIDSIDRKSVEMRLPSVPSRSALNQLNQARVNFKHFGNKPTIDDARKFRSDLDGFFPQFLREFLGIEYTEISLADLVQYRRAANWLRKAERYQEQSLYAEACACAAIAFEVFRSRWSDYSLWKHHFSMRVEISSRYEGSTLEIRSALSTLAHETEDRLKDIQDKIALIFDGVDILRYRRFASYTPKIDLDGYGAVISVFDEDGNLRSWDRDRLPEVTPGIATFCYRFAIDTILQMQSYPIPPIFDRGQPDISYEVIAQTELLVDPRSHESIRMVEPGETLTGYTSDSRLATDEHVVVVEDGDRLFVERSAIKQLQ